MKSVNYSQVQIAAESSIKSHNETLNKFFSTEGGLVESSSIFLTGTSGAGKTTFSITLQKLFEDYKTVFYSREMSSSSVKKLVGRYNIDSVSNAYIADREMCPNIESFIDELDRLSPKVVIIDSLQFIIKEDYAGSPVDNAIFDVIQKLREWTSKNNAVLIVVGHVTKDGDFEGKNTIQHMFDAHMEMIFDKKKNTRTISWAKNRFGAVGNILHYVFGKSLMEFYTEEEFEQTKNQKKVEDYIFEMIIKFLENFPKKDEKFKSFKNELTTKIKDFIKSKGKVSDFDLSFEAIDILKSLIKKHNLE